MDNLIKEIQGGVCASQDVLASSLTAGIKESGRPDMTLIQLPVGSNSSGVFTKNLVCAAPVVICREVMQKNALRAILINSGNANACTGEKGEDDARLLCSSLASLMDCKPENIAICSTGIIGVELPMDKMLPALDKLVSGLAKDNGGPAAEAIMTTDTCPKEYAVEVDFPEGKVRIGGMAKGAGMIAPDMATMLAFLTTDANISKEIMDQILIDCVNQTFNAITIDGDTSTNDTVIIASTRSSIKIDNEESISLFDFALKKVCKELSLSILRDGEGVSKVVSINVSGANNDSDAHLVARSVSQSLLVKTAINGELPNWGRILAAAGYSGADFDPKVFNLEIGDIGVMKRGSAVNGWENALLDILKKDEYNIEINLGEGEGTATVWTTDLSSDYVRINADYRT
jgi:glutamate N-acetyltransferase/amino-acid N-acetyltransferase